MSNWKTLLLRIGEKGPEYGTSSDYKDHIETCFGVIRREIERSGDQVLPVSDFEPSILGSVVMYLCGYYYCVFSLFLFSS
jgi:hypothetical protein